MALFAPDRKTTFRVLKLVLVIAFIVTSVGGFITVFGGHRYISASVVTEHVAASTALPQGTKVDGTSIKIPASQLSSRDTVMFRIYWGVLVGAVLLIEIMLIQLVDDVMKGNVFMKRNVRRLRFIATIFVLSMIETLLSPVITNAILSDLNLDLGVKLNLDFTPIIEAFGIFAVAEIFVYGIEQRQTLEATPHQKAA